MTLGVVGATPAVGGPGVPPQRHRSGFGELLSELNPLQYIPVVGTIYRAITHDTISDTARTVGSLVFSGLTGGPVGIALAVAAMAAEKATGIDPERLGRTVLADLGIARDTPPGTLQTAASAPEAPVPAAWSATQLHALGVSAAADGTLRLGALTGSDVLNTLELTRLA